MYWDQKDTLRTIINSLQQDKVIIISCDTVLGLFAPLSESSKLQLDDSMQEIIKKYWPGTLTIVFTAKLTLPDWLQSQQGTIAIRIPEQSRLESYFTRSFRSFCDECKYY